MLEVTKPSGLIVDSATFRIERADRVRLEWYSYGEPKTEANLCWQEHWLEGGRVRALAAVPWFMPSFSPSLEFPAVELLVPDPSR